MKSSALLKSVYKDCLDRGYILIGDQLLPPAVAAARGLDKPERKAKTVHTKTGWIDDTRNIKNKAEQRDMFIMLMEKEGLDCWPEFYFSTERLYRFDYAIPINPNSVQLKVAIECDGGTWSQGKSGHSSGTGLERDRNKNNLALANGWVIIRRTPDQMFTTETIELIKSVIKQRTI